MLALTERVYAAAQAPELWNGTLEEIAKLLEGESLVFFLNSSGRLPEILSLHEMSLSSWKQFAEYYAAINPIMQRCERQLAPDTTWFSHAVCLDAELERTEFYADFFEPNRMHHAVGMRLSSGGAISANLSCQRPRGAGAFGEQADVILQTLRPHLMQALKLRVHLNNMELQRLGLEAALEAYEHATIGLDSNGCVVVCSTGAHALLESKCRLTLRQGRLCCDEPRAQAALQALIGNALRQEVGFTSQGRAAGQTRIKSLASSMLLEAPTVKDLGRALRITVLPYRRMLPGQTVGLAALLFLSDCGRGPGSRGEALTSLYELTPTEARVADLLSGGLDAAEIAATLKLTRETVRFYIKRILSKTGVRRQTDLLRLMLSLPVSNLPSGR